MSRQANERRMRALVVRWHREGGSAASFAARHRVGVRKFGYWRRREALESRSGAPAEREARIEFRPVQLVDAVGTATLEIALPGGERVLVHPGATKELLAAAVAALRGDVGC